MYAYSNYYSILRSNIMTYLSCLSVGNSYRSKQSIGVKDHMKMQYILRDFSYLEELFSELDMSFIYL